MSSYILSLIFLLGSSLDVIFSSSIKTCLDHCVEKNLAFPLPRGEFVWSKEAYDSCGYNCRIASCQHGCHDLDESQSTCDIKCIEDNISAESCFQGCRTVEHLYLNQAQKLLDEVSLVVDIVEEGLRLRWNFFESFALQLAEISSLNNLWFVQTRPSNGNLGWKWIELSNAFKNGSLSAEIIIPIEAIDEIQIRLAFSFRHKVGTSRSISYRMPSKIITLDIISQWAVTINKYTACWKTNQPNAKYKVSLNHLDGNSISSIETTSSCHLFDNLPRENCCGATISILPEDSTATNPPEINIKIQLNQHEIVGAPIPTELAPPAPKLVLINSTHILQLQSLSDYIISEEPIIIPFVIAEGDSITAITSTSAESLLLGTQLGAIWEVRLLYNDTEVDTTTRIIREAPGDGSKINMMNYDAIQDTVYVVEGDKGIIRCTLSDPVICTTLTNIDPLNPIRQIVVDSINGFVYFLGADHQLYQAEAFPFNSTGTYQFVSIKTISELSPSSSIDIDLSSFQLFVALRNGSIVSRNLISQSISLYRPSEFTDISRLHYNDDRLFFTKEKCGETPLDEICFYSEEKNEEGILHNNRYLYNGKVIDFTFIEMKFQPTCMPPPSNIAFITTDIIAKLTWKPPIESLFQRIPSVWRNINYEIRMLPTDFSSPEVQDKTNNTSITLTVSPGVEYTVSVRACISSICSPYVNTVNSAFVALKDTPVVFIRRDGETISAIDLLGLETTMTDTVKELASHGDRLSTMDNTTKNIFIASGSEINRLRMENGISANSLFYEYMSIISISVIQSRSIIVFSSSYQIISLRLTGTFDHEIYSCSSVPDCDEVLGLSSDDSSGEVYYLTRNQNGTISLFELNQEDRSPRLLSSSSQLPLIRQFLIRHEKMMFVTQDGYIGFCDKKLGSINIDYSVDKISSLIPIHISDNIRNVTFNGEVSMSEGKKSELNWAVEPRQQNGGVLYKISLHKDKIGSGEKYTQITTLNQLTLPDELLKEWSSAQKFDVTIEGLTPWMNLSITKSSLQSPVKPPTVPTNLRIYATQQKTVDGPRAIISFFWSSPDEWNGAAFQFIVNCSKEDGTTQGGTFSSSVSHYSFAVKSGKVSCIVAAANEPDNIGEYSSAVSIDSSELNPLVRLFAIDSTNALIAITNITHDEPVRKDKRQIAQVNRMEYQAIAFIGNDLFAVRKEPDTIQPLLVQIDTNDIDNIVHKVSIGGEVSKIEAMTSDWVGNRLLFVSGMALYQLSLDPFLSSSILSPRKLIDLSTGATDAKQLTFDPFKNTAYLLTRNGSLFSLNLREELESNLALTVQCLSSQTVTWMMTEFAWNRASSPKIYALTWNGLIVVDVEENNKCNEVRIDWNKFGEKGLKAMSAFAIADKLFVFVTSSEMLIYGRETVVPIPISNPPLRQILAVSQSSQPYPERACFGLPSSVGIQFSVINEGKTGAFLEVVKPSSTGNCVGVSLPQTHYEVYFTRRQSDKVKHIRSYTDKIHVENGILDKETDYDVTVAWSNRYSDVNGISDSRTFRTGFGYPSAPRDTRVIPITPDTVYLYWNLPETLNAPIAEIKYKISQQASGLSSPSTIAVQQYSEGVFSPATTDTASCLSHPCRVKISNLRASTEYKFWITSIHKSHLNAQFLEDAEAMSQEASARTKDVAGTLRPDNVTGSSILLRWNSLQAEQPPSLISVQYKEAGSIDWISPANASFDSTVSTILVMINGLLSATTYDYRFVAAYSGLTTIDNKVINYKEDYYQGNQQVKTKAGVPTAPITVEAQMDEEGWILSWKEPLSDGGSSITSYAVEMRINKTSDWEIAERGLDGWKLWWRPAKTDKDQSEWEFRVRAANSEGFGAYGYSSDNRIIPPIQENNTSWIFIMLGVILFSVLILLISIIMIIRAHRIALLKKKEKDLDRNCITLEKMAAFHHQPTPQMSNELKTLPHVSPNCIHLNLRLGEGRFGDVFEGIAENLPRQTEYNINVAVKLLRHGYDEVERLKFMKEAILMNNFDHPNIVKLLGVCLDEDQPFLVLELMEGGDLLSFLRSSGPNEFCSSQLSLREILSMILDVARGGSYLESNHQVHRDLAARNCLVSSRSSTMRVVKIADFGFARDVPPDSHYYKVLGDDYLPLRWLAPESASQGIFSSKSDIWAFGVLLFEIVSLGRYPYEDKDNQQVLLFVQNGGIPSKPPHCPSDLHKLMQKCWSYDPSQRPSFQELLPLFEALRDDYEFQDDKPFPPYGGVCNEGFDESQDSTYSERLNGSLRDNNMTSSRSFELESTPSDLNRFDKSSSGSIVSKKQGRPSLIRSLRKEKIKPPPLPSPLDIDNAIQYSNGIRSPSSLSNDTISTSLDYASLASSSSYSAAARSPGFILPSNLLSYEQPKTRLSASSAVAAVIPHETYNHDVNLSRSWAGPSQIDATVINPNYGQRPSIPGPSSSRKGRAPLPPSTVNSYENPRRNRVSQV